MQQIQHSKKDIIDIINSENMQMLQNLQNHIDDSDDYNPVLYSHLDSLCKDKIKNNKHVDYENRVKQKIDNKYYQLLDFYKKKNNQFIEIINIYKNFDYMFLNENANYREKKNNLTKIQNKIDTYKQNLFIDDRKDKYENKNYTFYKSFHFYLLFFYYGLIISYFIFSNFFKEKKYKNIFLISLILLYISIPFILPYLMSLIYNVYIYLLEYKNIKEDVISYPNIIEDEN
tara:strand:- start:1081 stop:1770 length:690 start_codon:yes stop_codon:yes gene_type:complete